MSSGRYDIKGLDTEDTSVHTVDLSRCSSFSDRLPPDTSNMNVTLAALLSSQCNDTSDRTVPQDFVTPSSLDDEMLLNTIGQQKRSGSQIKPPPPIQNLATAESKLTAT
jgi:hypothetical protein